LINISLFVVLEKVKEYLISLESSSLGTMGPVATLVNNLFTFLNQNTSHIHELTTSKCSLTVAHLTRLIRETCHLEHIDCLRGDAGTAQTRVVKRNGHIIVLGHRSNALRNLSLGSTYSVMLVLGLVSQ
jgi:hypothetical protein